MEKSRSAFLAELEKVHLRCKVNSRLRSECETWVAGFLSLLFPQLRTERTMLVQGLVNQAEQLDRDLLQVLGHAGMTVLSAHDVLDELWRVVPQIRDNLLRDAKAIDEFDPASESVDEVILAYPGFYATAVYRIAHEIDRLGVALVPRLLSEHAHRATGVDIHPGAKIGVPFVIDHGTGIVIGQTSVIGDRVKVYQGVTIGALAVKKKLAKTKRHPTIEDDVVIYSGATILGGDTVVGARSVIGGNAWITESVRPGTVITDKAETVVFERKP